MLRKTWANKQVRKYLAQNYQVGRVNVFSGKKDASLVQQHQVFKLPTTLVFTPEGNLIGKVQGYAASASLRSILEKHEKFIAERQEETVEVPSLIAAAPTASQQTEVIPNIPAVSIHRSQTQTTSTNKPVSRGNELSTAVKKAPLRQVSRGQSFLHLDVPGMHEYSLMNKSQAREADQSLGLLIGSYTSYKQLRQMVSRFQRVWKGNMWVFAEEVNQIPVYKLVLGNYTSREEAEIYANVIYKIDKSNPAILDLDQLIN